MVKRLLDDWLSSYIEYTENTEPPLSFHIWTAISVLIGALERKVYMEWGHEIIYPNEFIILVGPSGRTRKGYAINIGRDFLQKIGANAAAEITTKEALIEDIASSVNTFKDGTTKRITFHCSVTHVVEELHVFLGESNVELLAWLTALYDSRATMDKRTKGSGSDTIEGVFYNLLAATAPQWMPTMFPKVALGGGFTSRVIFVVEDKKRKIVEDPTLTKDDLELRRKLQHDLEIIHNLSGEMDFSQEAYEAYTKWYREEEEKTLAGNPSIPDPRFDGFLSRKPTHIKKIAMAISASRGDDLVITLEDFERALGLLTRAEKKMTKAFGGLGESRFAAAMDALLQALMGYGSLRRSAFLRSTYRDISAWDLEQVEKALTKMRLLKVTEIPREGDALLEYVPPPEVKVEGETKH